MTIACPRCRAPVELAPAARSATCPVCGAQGIDAGLVRSEGESAEAETQRREPPPPTPGPMRRSAIETRVAPSGATPPPSSSGTFTSADPGLALEVARARQDPARSLGRYLILSEIGRGGMGVVSRAWDERLRRVVALKTIVGDAADVGLVERFQREAEAVARLKHPNIVSVHEVFDADGKHCLAMDFIDGTTLERALAHGKEGERFSLDRALEIVRSVARAVHHAHEQGVIHRDLKPQNIMLDGRGRAFVLDFGLASIRDGRPRVTKTGSVLGTPAYMPPEQASGGGVVDERSDVYSLGATLYHVLTGRPPFDGTEINVLTALFTKDPEPPSRLSRRVTADLETICLKCLEKDPRNRYASAALLADDLERYLKGDSIAARPIGRAEKARRWAKRNRLLVAALSLLVLVVPPAIVYPIVVAGRDEKRRQEEDAAKQAAVEKRHARLEAILASASAPGDDLTDRRYDELLRDLLEVKDGETPARLAKALDDVTAALREATRSFYLRAKEPTPDEARAGERTLDGLEDAVSRDFDLARDRDPRSAALLAAAGKRLEDRAALVLPLTLREGSPSQETLLADHQERMVSPGKLRIARLACDALGRMRAREGVLGSLGSYLLVERDGARAAYAGEALIEIGGKEAVSLLVLGRRRFSEYGSFWLRTRRVLRRTSIDMSWPAKTAAELRDRGLARDESGDARGAYEDLTRAIELDPRLADAFRDRANVLFQLREVDRALADFERAIELDPREPRNWSDRGLVRESKGDPEGALADYTKALEVDPRAFFARTNRGALLARTGEVDAALADIERGLALSPRVSHAWSVSAFAWLTKGKPEKALEAAARAVQLDPEDAEAWTNRGAARFQTGDRSGAIADFTKAIDLDPRESTRWFDRGSVREVSGDLEGAIADYTKTIELAPSDGQAFRRRAIVRQKKGELAESLADFTKGIEVSPRDFDIWIFRGKLRSETGDLVGAIADFSAAAELAPDRPEPLSLRGSTRSELNDLDGALADLTRSIEIRPMSPSYSSRAEVRVAMGDLAGALADANRAIELGPDDSSSWGARSKVKRRTGDLEGALADITRAVELNPRVPNTWVNRATIRSDKGDQDGALADLARAIELDPRCAEAWGHRGLVRLAKGDRRGARADLERCLELAPSGPSAEPARAALATIQSER
ncbi:tetratricopeptide repeat protein [bacterium]|nr:tetratricopeptide repeat protein [bacterium]